MKTYVNVQVLLARASWALAACCSLNLICTEELYGTLSTLGLLGGQCHWRFGKERGGAVFPGPAQAQVSQGSGDVGRCG